MDERDGVIRADVVDGPAAEAGADALLVPRWMLRVGSWCAEGHWDRRISLARVRCVGKWVEASATCGRVAIRAYAPAPAGSGDGLALVPGKALSKVRRFVVSTEVEVRGSSPGGSGPRVAWEGSSGGELVFGARTDDRTFLETLDSLFKKYVTRYGRGREAHEAYLSPHLLRTVVDRIERIAREWFEEFANDYPIVRLVVSDNTGDPIRFDVFSETREEWVEVVMMGLRPDHHKFLRQSPGLQGPVSTSPAVVRPPAPSREWVWVLSEDGETWPCDEWFGSKDAAVAHGRGRWPQRSYHVGRWRKALASDFVAPYAVSELVEKLVDSAGDECGEAAIGWLSHRDEAAEADLRAQLHRLVDDWAASWGVAPTFGPVRDVEEVETTNDTNDTNGDEVPALVMVNTEHYAASVRDGEPHYNAIDARTAEGAPCTECGAARRYEGYKGDGWYRAFAICRRGHVVEF